MQGCHSADCECRTLKITDKVLSWGHCKAWGSEKGVKEGGGIGEGRSATHWRLQHCYRA